MNHPLEFNEIRLQADGSVTFLHLTPELLPVCRALGGEVEPCPPPASPPGHWRLRAHQLPVGADELARWPEADLWAFHRERPLGEGATLLELKRELAYRLLSPCRLCARYCPVDRRRERGWCGLLGRSEVFGLLVHYGEEPPLVPSLLVYLSGCNYRCRSCQTGGDFEGKFRRRRWAPATLAAHLDHYYRAGVWNVNFLGGEPSLHLPYILETLGHLCEPIHVVWNSNMHIGRQVLSLLDGVADYYLADLKFGNDRCASEIARVTPYWEVVTQAIEGALRQPAEVIVRTLPLPGHQLCCAEPIHRYLQALGVRVSEGCYLPWWQDLKGQPADGSAS